MSEDPRAQLTAILADPNATDKPARVATLYREAEEGATPDRPPASAILGTSPASSGLDARARYEQIRNDKQWIAGKHPQQAAVTTEYTRLTRELNPEAPQEETPEQPPPEKSGEAVPECPDPGLAPVWHDEGVREVTAGLGNLGMAPDETARWLHWASAELQKEPPDPEATIETLRAEWKEDFGKKLLAARAATKRLGPAFEKFLCDTALGDDINVVRKMAELGRPLVEKAEAIERINSGRALWDARDPEHERAVNERARLFKLLYPD
jgi:hypothetical protein